MASKPSSWVPKPPGNRAIAEASLRKRILRVKKYLKLMQLGVVGDDDVGLLLVGQADGHAERGGAAGPALSGAHDAVARPGDDHPAALAHAAGEGHGLEEIGVVGGRAARAEDRDLADVMIGGEDLEGVPQLLEGVRQELEVAAAGAVAGQARDGHHQVGEDVAVGAVRGEAAKEVVDGGVAGGGPGVGRRFAGDGAGLGLGGGVGFVDRVIVHVIVQGRFYHSQNLVTQYHVPDFWLQEPAMASISAILRARRTAEMGKAVLISGAKSASLNSSTIQ